MEPDMERIEELVANYCELAAELADELANLITAKKQALEQRNFDEVYRVAGVMTYLCNKAERYDREIFLKLGKEREDDRD